MKAWAIVPAGKIPNYYADKTLEVPLKPPTIAYLEAIIPPLGP